MSYPRRLPYETDALARRVTVACGAAQQKVPAVIREKNRGVHYKIENFLQVQGPADLLGNVEQHAQLVGRS